ncbi:META domain-containing protein [Sunxiuqinia sp. sy24]|uniref:META domain-containing protein n=1 Tax=Sunxiuqinia sp. sy24 TaxID=3461495 RepID=UPI0040462641
MMKGIFSLLLVAMLFSCSTQKNVYWVNSSQVDCMGVGPMACMQVQKGNDIEESQWQNFYSTIDGFDYEPGYIYQLKVKEEHLPKEEVPADASSIKYTLVKVLDKQVDHRAFVDGKWLLARISGGPVNRSVVLPTLEIDLENSRIFGSGGCNSYSGPIQQLTQDAIQLGNVASTRRACMNRNIEDTYLKALSQVATYKAVQSELVFYGEDGAERLAFIRQYEDEKVNQNLNDIWALETMNGERVTDFEERPVLEIHLAEMRAVGTDGCNHFMGDIKKLDAKNLEFGVLAGTRKMCRTMTVPDQFGKSLQQVKGYQLVGLTLTLSDESGKELLKFKKVD